MRYIEIISEIDLQKQQVDAQKKAAKRATRAAKSADLRLKLQKRNSNWRSSIPSQSKPADCSLRL